MKGYAVRIPEREKAQLTPVEDPHPPGPEEVRGRTLFTLISPGTELAAHYTGAHTPAFPGYAAVFRVEEAGERVETVKPGDPVFFMGGHRSIHRTHVREVVALPPGLAPEKAVVARLMSVTITTLMTTTARPGDRVMVTGAGPVGYLCAHLFRNAGYRVMVVDPREDRQNALRASGIGEVYPRVPLDHPELVGQVALAIDCSGHEQAVLDACRIVRKKGEVVLVGAPWKRRTDLSLHDLLHEIFHRYVVLRSGWEWELPRFEGHFEPHSIEASLKMALQWLSEDRIPLDGHLGLVHPEQAQEVYQGLLHGSFRPLFAVFDWRGV